MNILRSLPLLLLLTVPCQGGRVFGIEYDIAYYVLLRHDSAKTDRISLFDADGQPTKAVSTAVCVEPTWVLDALDKLFKDASAFTSERRVAPAPKTDGFVFYNNGNFVLAICPGGTVLGAQPSLDKEYQLNMEQMKKYQRIVSGMRKDIYVATDSPKGTMLYWKNKKIDGKLPNQKKG